jgi:hypothetical protein
VGRPPAPPREVNPDLARTLGGAVVAFLKAHPGCVSVGPERHYYGDSLRVSLIVNTHLAPS